MLIGRSQMGQGKTGPISRLQNTCVCVLRGGAVTGPGHLPSVARLLVLVTMLSGKADTAGGDSR